MVRIGHISSATTANTHAYITDEMWWETALNIARGIEKAEVQWELE